MNTAADSRASSASTLAIALALGAVYLVWGSSYIATKIMVTDEPPLVAAGLRFTIAGILLIAFSALRYGPPVLTRTDQWVIRAAKRFGLIDRLTPAGRTLGRREEFADRETARAYFAGKSLFRSFDPDCFEAYLEHGLQPVDDRLRLSFDPATEIDIYRSVPDTSPGRAFQLQVPLTVVRGRDSRVVMNHHAKAVSRMPNGESLSVPGGHMFPLEQPQDTARLLKQIFARWELRHSGL